MRSVCRVRSASRLPTVPKQQSLTSVHLSFFPSLQTGLWPRAQPLPGGQRAWAAQSLDLTVVVLHLIGPLLSSAGLLLLCVRLLTSPVVRCVAGEARSAAASLLIL